MAIKINLLPSELKVSKSTAQALKLSRMLGVVALAVFLVFGLVLGAFFIISSIQLNQIKQDNEGLRSQIKTLQSSESQAVALKDRIGKIRIIEKMPSALENFNDFEPVLSELSESTVVSGLEIDATKISASMVFKSNGDIRAFVESFSEGGTFKVVDFDSFSFNPAVGYSVSVTIASQ